MLLRSFSARDHNSHVCLGALAVFHGDSCSWSRCPHHGPSPLYPLSLKSESQCLLSELTQCARGWPVLVSFSAPLLMPPGRHMSGPLPPQQFGSPTSPLPGVPFLAMPSADSVLFTLNTPRLHGMHVFIPGATVYLKNM